MYRVWKCLFGYGAALKKQDDPALEKKKKRLELVKEREIEVG